MNNNEDIVELSENDDDDDCIFCPVIYEDEKLNETSPSKNSLLTEFIDTCLKLENSEEMSRVINRTLLKMYMKTDIRFKESQVFKKALRRANNLVKTEPSFIYSHIKDLCEILKSSGTKKRVQLITLTNNIKENKLPTVSCKRKSDSENVESSKKQKIDIIDLDFVEDSTNGFNKGLEETASNGICVGKENSDITCPLDFVTDENKLLLPRKSLECNIHLDNCDDSNNDQINKINEKIAHCKRVIAQLEEKEVCFDSKNSPYVKCERLKARIVLLYKELCKLTGEVPVRKSNIHLNVMDGHPAAAVKRLEKFLNRNVGSDGNPLFPNFRDVVKCVLKANEKENLGWSKQQIMNEACSLFTHCGRALQKRRQQREWRDLLCNVKQESSDPADSDPALLARLEANRLTALKKENEILERYSRMQNMPQQKDTELSNQDIDDDECSNKSDSDIDSSSDESENEQLPNNSLVQIASTSKEIHKEPMNVENGADSKNEENDSCTIKVKKEPELNLNQVLEELGEDHRTTIEIEDPFVFIEISDSSSEDSE